MFLTSMSHELRTPLNAIIGFAGTLLDDENEPLSSYRKDRLSRILQSGKQLLQLINSLLDLSRLEAGQMKITNSKMRLDELILEVIEMLEPLIQEKSLECKHHFDTEKGWEEYQMEAGENYENPFFLVSDSAKLRQVLINLLGNAIKFTEPGGSITIRLFRKRQGFQIDIEDNGCGIPEEDLGTIFQVFQQAETDNRPHREGTGLGLALVHSLVELIGARISVKSTLGEGSAFTLELPLQS
jgi:signal transduction histidine kinase